LEKNKKSSHWLSNSKQPIFGLKSSMINPKIPCVFLTSKERRSSFSKNGENLPFLAQEAQK
jgi:hypothetical protein